MGRQIRDERQKKALTGLSQAQVDSLLCVCSDLSQATQQKTSDKGIASGTRRRTPGGGGKGTWPTIADTLLFALSSYKTYPTFDVLGTPGAMARSQAHEHLPQLAPRLSETRVSLELMPERELATPEEWKAALPGGDHLRMDATARADHRSQEDAKQRERDRGKKNGIH